MTAIVLLEIRRQVLAGRCSPEGRFGRSALFDSFRFGPDSAEPCERNAPGVDPGKARRD